MKTKQILSFLLAGTLLLSLVGCESEEIPKDLKTGANEIVDAFEQSDINSINAIIFDSSSLEVDEELEEYISEAQEDSGILAQIFAVDTIGIDEIDETNNEIIYEIKAPDLSDVFSGLSENAADMEETDLEEYLLDYIQAADTVTTSVSVRYTYEGEVFSANYRDTEFINAITGGLLDAYQTLYQQMVHDYLQDMEDTE